MIKIINTILFDLDGTLLPMDTELFIKRYFKELAVKLKDHLTPEEVTKNLWESTKYMMEDGDKEKTNEQAFFEDFYKDMPHKEEVLTPLLEEFYEKDFNKVQDVSRQNEDMIASIKLLKEKGYKLVVATNPLFPRMAVINRIKWAGLNPEDFMFITSFEHMHFCKPDLDYYREILYNIEKEAKECIMVGNDVNEDMIVKEIGIKTYLIEDFIIGDIKNDKNIDYRGSYRDFYHFAKELTSLK